MQRVIFGVFAAASFTLAISQAPTGHAQQPSNMPPGVVQQQQQFVPIVIDQLKFKDIYLELRKISMPADALDAVSQIFNRLEQQAQLEALQAAAAKRAAEEQTNKKQPEPEAPKP